MGLPGGLSDDPVAIVGMSCRLPDADGLDEYWDLISNARCGLRTLPESRFNRELYFDPREGVPGKSYVDIGGVAADRPFLNEGLLLPETVAAEADPAHLTMLDVVREAIVDAAIPFDSLRRSRTGTYVGHARGTLRSAEIAYAHHAPELTDDLSRSAAFAALPAEIQSQVMANVEQSIRDRFLHRVSPDVSLHSSQAAALVARAFDLNGPTAAIDAACASSMAALHAATHALLHDRIDMAIVGGASYSNWTSLVVFSSARAVSRTGSFPFDARADGFVSSDGFAAVVIKRLSRAMQDGDRVLGVIRGIGLSTDGRGKSLWAPRKQGQILAIQRSWADGVDPSQIQFIEAHGTSTQLGDATELDALATALSDRLGSRRIPISSVKANIGHTRETAGLAGVIKTLLAMKHQQIPPAAGFETPNPEIPWRELPFYVPTSPVAWPVTDDGTPRRAAVDAFGIGGLNGHVVIDDGHSAVAAASRAVSVPVPNVITPRDESPQADEKTERDPIAVIGMGAILPGARTIEAVTDLFVSGRDPRSRVPNDRWSTELLWSGEQNECVDAAALRGGFITDFEYDWRRNRIPPKQVQNADPIQFMVLDAAEQALESAGWRDRPFDSERCAVVVGTEFNSDFGVNLTMGMRTPEFVALLTSSLKSAGIPDAEARTISETFGNEYVANSNALHDETASYTSSTLASRITKTFDLMGGAYSVDAGGCSSFAAIAAGLDQLRSHCCDTVLCAGAQRSMDIAGYSTLAGKRLLATTSRPGFDSNADGFVPGECTVVLLLKRLADAARWRHDTRRPARRRPCQ